MTRPRGRKEGSSMRRLAGQRGITGLETAIVLIAFVVVASVFAFAILSTGMKTSERSKEAILAGVEEAGSTLVLRGVVVAIKNATSTTIDSIQFDVTNASRIAEPVNMATSGNDAAVVTYVDSDNSLNSTTWTATWLSGSGSQLNPGETVEISIPLTSLSTPLGPSKRFSIELKPTVGASLKITRTTPVEFTPVMNLD